MFPVWWHVRTEIQYTDQSEPKPRWMIASGCVWKKRRNYLR